MRSGKRVGHIADGPYSVGELIWPGGRRTDRDRRLADSRQIKHVELPRQKSVSQALALIAEEQIVAAHAGDFFSDADDAGSV